MSAAEKAKLPVKDGLWEVVEGEAFLVGSRCASCGELFFPRKESGFCPHCQHKSLKDERLSREGQITTYTVVHQPPAGGFYKGPVPFAYGVVQLPEGVNVQTLFTGCELERIRVGLTARLVIEKLFDGDDGSEIITYKFAPVL
jgi:uncharacterized OB-fold protein